MDQPTDRIVGGVNSTPLIALSIVGHLDLSPLLFDHVLIPTSVHMEVLLQGRGRPGSLEIGEADWLTVMEPEEATPLPAELMGLDEGEIDVILLARELKADWALVDEKLARQIAKAVGLQVKGTLGRNGTQIGADEHRLRQEKAVKICADLCPICFSFHCQRGVV